MAKGKHSAGRTSSRVSKTSRVADTKKAKRTKKDSINSDFYETSDYSESTKHEHKFNVKFLIIILIVAVLVALGVLFRDKLAIIPEKISSLFSSNSEEVNASSSNETSYLKKVENLEDVQIRDYNVSTADNGKTKISITLENPSDQTFSNFMLHVVLFDSNHEQILDCDVYVEDMSSKSSRSINIYSQETLDDISDLTITKTK